MAEWRVIKGEEGRYAVSNEGEVMSMDFAFSGLPGILKPSMGRGYFYVQLSNRKRYSIHRLVCEAFIGPRPATMQINHKNGVKTDNRLENLEYCTQSENMKHAFSIGLQSNKGENHSQACLTEEKVIQIMNRISAGERQGSIARSFGISQSQVSYINSGKAWPHVTRKAG